MKVLTLIVQFTKLCNSLVVEWYKIKYKSLHRGLWEKIGTIRVDLHTPVYGVKEIACLSDVCMSVTNFDPNYNKTGLQPVSRLVEQILGFFRKVLIQKMVQKCVQKMF